MLGTQLVLGSTLIIASVIMHVAGLVGIAEGLRRIEERRTTPRTKIHTVMLLVAAVLGILTLHTTETWAWALAYYLLGEFSDFSQALYFSAVTATTLGYGDITLSVNWRIFGTFESMGGLILFGASTAFLLEIFRRAFFVDDKTLP